MAAAVFDHVVDPETGFPASIHRFTAKNLGQLLDVRLIGGIVDEFSYGIGEFVGCELQQVDAQGDRFLPGTNAVPALISEQWYTKHWNTMVQSFVLTVGSTVRYKEPRLRMTQYIILWKPRQYMNVVWNLKQNSAFKTLKKC
jgi:hypothetical protein